MRKIVWLLAAWLGWKVYRQAQISYADTVAPVDIDAEPAPAESFPVAR